MFLYYNIFTVKPYLKLPKTATFIEGEKVELECIVFGSPTPEVSWKFGKCLKIFHLMFSF